MLLIINCKFELYFLFLTNLKLEVEFNILNFILYIMHKKKQKIK